MRLTHPVDSKKRRRGERRLKAVAVLPSLATLGNLVCGFGAIYMCALSIASGGGDLERATLSNSRIEQWFPTYLAIGAYLLLGAMAFDALDGRLARLTRKTSDFGAQLDSMSDMVSFGVAPAFLMLCIVRHMHWGASSTPLQTLWWRAEWAMFAVYACCAAIRLARFNVENVADESAHRYFRGLPSPGAAAVVVSMVILHEEFLRKMSPEWKTLMLQGVAPPLTMLIGLLMVSRFRYPHLVNTVLRLRGRRPLSHVIVMLAVIGVAFLRPHATFVALSLGYALIGPIGAIFSRKQVAPSAESGPASHEVAPSAVKSSAGPR